MSEHRKHTRSSRPKLVGTCAGAAISNHYKKRNWQTRRWIGELLCSTRTGDWWLSEAWNRQAISEREQMLENEKDDTPWPAESEEGSSLQLSCDSTSRRDVKLSSYNWCNIWDNTGNNPPSFVWNVRDGTQTHSWNCPPSVTIDYNLCWLL